MQHYRDQVPVEPESFQGTRRFGGAVGRELAQGAERLVPLVTQRDLNIEFPREIEAQNRFIQVLGLSPNVVRANPNNIFNISPRSPLVGKTFGTQQLSVTGSDIIKQAQRVTTQTSPDPAVSPFKDMARQENQGFAGGMGEFLGSLLTLGTSGPDIDASNPLDALLVAAPPAANLAGPLVRGLAPFAPVAKAGMREFIRSLDNIFRSTDQAVMPGTMPGAAGGVQPGVGQFHRNISLITEDGSPVSSNVISDVAQPTPQEDPLRDFLSDLGPVEIGVPGRRGNTLISARGTLPISGGPPRHPSLLSQPSDALLGQGERLVAENRDFRSFSPRSFNSFKSPR